MNIINEEHKKEVLMLIQSQNRQIAQLQEEHEKNNQSLAKGSQDGIQIIKEQMNERIKFLEGKLLDLQKEMMEKVIDARKNAYKEAEQYYENQKEIVKKEIKEERNKIIQEIVDKLAEEHMEKVSKLNRKIQLLIEEKNLLIQKLESKNEEKKQIHLVDSGTITEKIAEIKQDEAKSSINIVKPILECDYKVQYCEIELKKYIEEETVEFKENVELPSVDYKLLWAKMNKTLNISREIIDILRGKLKAATVKYSNLCIAIQELTKSLCE